MTFTVTHTSGEMEVDPSENVIDDLIDELDVTDAEHPDVSLSHESGWTLSAYSSGKVVWENVNGTSSPRHLPRVGRLEVSRLMRLLARGEISEIDSAAWSAGYGKAS